MSTQIPGMHQIKSYSWHKISDNASTLMFGGNNIVEIEVEGKRICISRYRETFYACAALCPHASGTMANGYLDSIGNIVCPVHRYKFNIKTGRNTTGEGYFLKTYPVETRDDGIYIGLELR